MNNQSNISEQNKAKESNNIINDDNSENEDNDIDHMRYKIIFVGDSGTSKTEIISKIIDNPFSECYEPSIGVDFMSKQIKFRKKVCRLQIWDTSGQEKYKGLIPSYVRNSSIVFFNYDISNRNSFNNIPRWIEFIRSINNPIDNPILVLCGSMAMVESNREVEKKEGEELAIKENLLFYEINLKTEENIKNMFYSSLIELPIFKELLNLEKEYILDELLKENEPDYYKIIY